MSQYIAKYKRADAIRDGVLIDINDIAAQAGFRFHVAMTDSVYVRCIEVTDQDEGQDEQGRLWDMLMMLKQALRMQTKPSDRLNFEFIASHNNTMKTHCLKSICSGGDEGEPVITIMQPEED